MTALRQRIDGIKADLDTQAAARASTAAAAKGSVYRTIDMLRPGRPVASRAIGLLAWSKTRRYDDDSPMGGVVVEVIVSERAYGEIVRMYKVVDPYRDRPTVTWHVLSESDVDPDTITRADTFLAGHVGRRLLEDAIHTDRYHFREGAFRPEHTTLVRLVLRLLEAL